MVAFFIKRYNKKIQYFIKFDIFSQDDFYYYVRVIDRIYPPFRVLIQVC